MERITHRDKEIELNFLVPLMSPTIKHREREREREREEEREILC